MTSQGFVPPPYPQDRLDALKKVADALPGGMVDCSVGNPVDPVPEVALEALAASAALGNTYPPTIGSPDLRGAASRWLRRRAGVDVDPTSEIIACIGTKELVASLPHYLALRDPSRDTILFPAVAYPTYEMGATLAGLRSVPVSLHANWHIDLDSISAKDASRALVLWLNYPGNPTSTVAGAAEMARIVEWGRENGVLIASDECYYEFSGQEAAATALGTGNEGVIAVHSVSKRSNLAGFRAGFIAGDNEIVKYLGEVRKHAGLMVPGPVQAAAAAVLDDDEHVDIQRARYSERRALMLDGLARHGLIHEGGSALFYLWLRSSDGVDGWTAAARLAESGLIVAPGDLYGAAGVEHVRLALTQPNERLHLALERLDAQV
ncbi:MAG: succinyldiaminopimelate transaminase [Actinobacteria bacterium]|nr:succinyldiaminopimelate transaminase [Actinomycetota bacterium]